MAQQENNFTITYKGYRLVQNSDNHHYMIFNSDNRMVMHAQYGEPLTEQKAKEQIDFYINIVVKRAEERAKEKAESEV